MIKKLILLTMVALVTSSCGYEIRRKPEPPKPKLTKEQIQKQEYEQQLEKYRVQFLFECDGVKVYRFSDYIHTVYFTNANGTTSYRHTRMIGKVHHTQTVQSINTKR